MDADNSPSGPPGEPGKYLYCVIRAQGERVFGSGGVGDGGSPIYTVPHRGLAAVVSDTPLGSFDPTSDNVLAHEAVNAAVLRDCTLIPVSFGTIFRSREDVVALLKSGYKAFDDVLARLRDKLEFGLKVLWDRERAIADLEGGQPELQRLRQEIAAAPGGSAYFQRLQLARLLENALAGAARDHVRRVEQALRPVAVASRTNPPIGERMVLNAAYLVERQRERAFDAAVQDLGRRFGDRLSFQYTGPWPAYNFVTIRLRLERSSG